MGEGKGRGMRAASARRVAAAAPRWPPPRAPARTPARPRARARSNAALLAPHPSQQRLPSPQRPLSFIAMTPNFEAPSALLLILIDHIWNVRKMIRRRSQCEIRGWKSGARISASRRRPPLFFFFGALLSVDEERSSFVFSFFRPVSPSLRSADRAVSPLSPPGTPWRARRGTVRWGKNETLF